MKILHIITGLEYGGAQSLLLSLLRQFKKSEVENMVISLTSLGPVGEQMQANGISVKFLEMKNGLLPIRSFIRLFKNCKKFTTRPYPNLALSCRPGWCAHKVIGYKYPPGLGNSPHSLSVNALKKSTRIVMQINRLLAKFLPDKIICCSKSAYQSHINFGFPVSKMVMIPNGIDNDHPNLT